MPVPAIDLPCKPIERKGFGHGKKDKGEADNGALRPGGTRKRFAQGLPFFLFSFDLPASVEVGEGRVSPQILKKYARYGVLVIDEWLTEDDDVDISFLFELVERRFSAKSTIICSQYTPAEWHGRLGGGAQADAMVDRLMHGSMRIDLGDVNVRKLLAERKQRRVSAKRAIRKRRGRRCANSKTGGAHAAK